MREWIVKHLDFAQPNGLGCPMLVQEVITSGRKSHVYEAKLYDGRDLPPTTAFFTLGNFIEVPPNYRIGMKVYQDRNKTPWPKVDYAEITDIKKYPNCDSLWRPGNNPMPTNRVAQNIFQLLESWDQRKQNYYIEFEVKPEYLGSQSVPIETTQIGEQDLLEVAYDIVYNKHSGSLKEIKNKWIAANPGKEVPLILG